MWSFCKNYFSDLNVPSKIIYRKSTMSQFEDVKYQVTKSSRLCKLDSFLDISGVLQVNGILQRSELTSHQVSSHQAIIALPITDKIYEAIVK